MPTFGQHETTQRLYLSGVGGLYALKTDDKKVIKVLHPPEGIWSEETIREEIDGFLLRAKTQKRLAKASKNWAPVHETGGIRAGAETSGGDIVEQSAVAHGEYRASGAYAIMDRYERSVKSLIDGRVNVTNGDLRTIMSGVILGLIDIRKSGSRPHGNLKATNILLAHSTDLAAATVHLADPAPDGALTKASNNKDLTDLAKILYELVNLRPYDGGTIPKTKDWNELGPNGEDWRKLCNTLLDTQAPTEERDLEKILPVIATWTLKPKKNKTPMIAAASLLVLVVGGGGAAWYFTRPPKLDFNEANWQQLCLSYYGWFGDFSDKMSDDATRKKFGTAPYPAEVVKLFTDASKDLDKYRPKIIAKKPSAPEDLAVNPTDDAKTGYGPYYTQEGDKLIEAVAAALTPQHWQLLQQLDKTAKTYQERGWQKPAAGIRTLIDSAKPPLLPLTPPAVTERVKLVQPVDVYTNIEKTIKAAKTVTDIDARWTRIQEDLKKLPQGDAQSVPLLKALPTFAEEFPRSQASPDAPGTLQDVTSLSTAFTQIDALIIQLATDLSQPGKEIVYSELAKDPAAQVADNMPLTVESFATLPATARGYIKITDDPRATTNWTKSLADVQTNAIAVIQEANAQDTNLPTLKKAHEDIAKLVADWAGIAPIEKNRDELKRRVATAQASLKSLEDNANTWVTPYIVDPPVYLASQRNRVTSSPLAKATPVVYAAWKEHHNALLAKAAAAPEGLKKYATYKDFDDKFNAMEKTFIDIEALIPHTVPGLSDVAGNDWRHTITTYVASTFREAALKDIIAALHWTDNKPQLEEPAFVSSRTNRLKDFDQTCTDTLALVADYTTITDRFDHLDLRPNEPAANAASWRDLFTKWQTSKHPLLADATVVAALKPLTDRVTALLAMDAVTDYKPLVAGTASPAAEIALTAWRKLGAATVSEDLPVLDDEDKAQAALTEKLAALHTAKTLTDVHFQVLSTEMADQRPVRWRRWADTLSSAPAVQTALDRAASFRVTLTKETDPAMFYNQTFYALRKEFEKNLKEAELKPIAQRFVTAVSALPASVSGDKDIQDLLARMTKSLSQSQEESSALGAGPKLANWEQDNSKDGIRLFYFPTKAAPKYTLEFVRLQVANKTIFLCTTEMPFGLFADTVNAANKFSDLDNAGKPSKAAHWFKDKVSSGAWEGPLIWKITDRKFFLNLAAPSWLFQVPQMRNAPFYPPDATPAIPSVDLPMQYLSPWSAIYAARLLGCRLPTSEEWKAAYDKYEANNSTAPKDAWNLRGEAWNKEQDYAKSMAKNGMKYADAGAYIPPEFQFDSTKTSESAKPWKAADLAKLAPTRITAGPDIYKGSVIWFRKVGAQPGVAAPGSGAGGMHDLVGNVAEYVFDGSPDKPANAVIKDTTPTVAAIDDAITAGRKGLYVIGGSSLSLPDMALTVKQPLDPNDPQTAVGFSDVGFRLAYTAPIDSIIDVLASAFKEPKYLPGPKAKS